MEELVFLNGKFVKKTDASISALSAGALYGFGLFETMRSYKKKIIYLNEHINRISGFCAMLGMALPYQPKKLKEIIAHTAAINGYKDSRVRMTFWKAKAGTDILVTAQKYVAYPKAKYEAGFSVLVSPYRQDENSLYSRIKTTNRIIYQLSLQEARLKGCDEAIMLNSRGYITEGSRSNLFFIKSGDIFTPGLASGCLAGITRKVIFDLAEKLKFKIYEGYFTAKDLIAADEAFLTNSLMGVMPVTCLGKNRIPKGRGKLRITRLFIKNYDRLFAEASINGS